MLCSFININNKQLICENCGRKIPYSNNNGISAKCRIPSKLIKRNNPIIPKLDISIGVGDILKELLDKIHIKYDVGCSCNSKLSVLNRKGPEWCQKNIQTIIK